MTNSPAWERAIDSDDAAFVHFDVASGHYKVVLHRREEAYEQGDAAKTGHDSTCEFNDSASYPIEAACSRFDAASELLEQWESISTASLQFRYNLKFTIVYSYLNDSIGSRRDALFAGSKPNMTPINMENRTPPTMTGHDTSGGHPAK